MTLILTVANASGIYQSSDYQLTDRDTGAPVSDRAGSKQLQATFRGLLLQLAFTGIAEVGAGLERQRTIDWLSRELKTLPQDCQLQDICEALARQCTSITRPHGLRGVLEVIVTIATVGEPFRVVVISNGDWTKRPPEAKPQFTIAAHTITKPFHLISGYRDSVSANQRHRLRALAREIGNPEADISNALTEINALAARNSRGCVSEDCWVTSQFADGRTRRTASRNIGQHPGDVHSIFGNLDLPEFIRKNFRVAPGEEIRLVQSAGVAAGPGDGIPLPPPSGEARRFTLSGSSVIGSLRNAAGVECASITITQLDCGVEIHCNEEVTVPFAQLILRGVGQLGTDFPKPLHPWPHLSPALAIDDAAVPRGWEYHMGYWVEGEAHHVTILQSSRSIRNVAFLGADDEMVIVAPSTTLELEWDESGQGPSATFHARVSWRSRLDGTHG